MIAAAEYYSIPMYPRFKITCGKVTLLTITHQINLCCLEELLTAGGENRNGKNTKASEVHHPTSWDIITPVIVVGVLVFLALVVGFCYYVGVLFLPFKTMIMQFWT